MARKRKKMTGVQKVTISAKQNDLLETIFLCYVLTKPLTPIPNDQKAKVKRILRALWKGGFEYKRRIWLIVRYDSVNVLYDLEQPNNKTKVLIEQYKAYLKKEDENGNNDTTTKQA